MRASLDPPPAAPEPPGLYAALAARAQQASDWTLAGLAGALAGLALAAWRPGWWWVYALPLVAAGAFGLWGIAERERAELATTGGSPRARRAPTAVQWFAVAVGTGAAVLVGFAVLGVLLGTIIS
jgi:hypothetical protein